MEKERDNVENEKAFAKLRVLHDEAFHCISQGIRAEENKQNSAALQLYLSGKEKLLEALLIKITPGEQYQSARTMQTKMKKHLEELKNRISSLQREGPRNEAPPPYQEMNSNAVNDGKAVPNSESQEYSRPRSMNAEEIFSISEGVFLFQVSPEGRVSSPQPSAPLQVMCLIPNDTCTSVETEAANANVPPPAFLQVGNWVCPLVPGQTIVLKTGYGAYMFPDLENRNQEGPEFVGIILPSELGTDERDNFEHLLVELTLYREEEEQEAVEQPTARLLRAPAKPEDERFSHKISNALVTGAGYLGTALGKSAEWTGYWVQQGAHKLRERMIPEDRPVKVDPRLQSGLQVARGATSAARRCSGFLVGKLGEMTCALAKQAAPHVRYYGNRLLVQSGIVEQDTVDSANNNTVVDDLCVVAAGGVQSFSVLYMSLENAARQLASCLASETVQIVHHKYGTEASEVVDNAVSSLGNLALATNNIRSFGVKAIAKRTAKDTGKAVLKEYVEKHPEDDRRNQ